MGERDPQTPLWIYRVAKVDSRVARAIKAIGWSMNAHEIVTAVETTARPLPGGRQGHHLLAFE
jgi:hypothetical protein